MKTLQKSLPTGAESGRVLLCIFKTEVTLYNHLIHRKWSRTERQSGLSVVAPEMTRCRETPLKSRLLVGTAGAS